MEDVEINWSGDLQPGPAGDWSNYIKAAIKAVRTRWDISHGIEAKVTSDLPAAAGLSSSSALLTGFTIALLRANGIEPGVAELMEVLPDGEQFVGTRGGGMDHAAVLASRTGCALLVEFAPLRLVDVPIPDSWSFIVCAQFENGGEVGRRARVLQCSAGGGAKRAGEVGHCILSLRGGEAFARRFVATE